MSGIKAMRRGGFTLHSGYRAKPVIFENGRRIRNLDGLIVVLGDEKSPRLFGPLFYKTVLALTGVATVTIAVALWRLFHFAH
jgi:hypothetical protein